MRWFSRKQKLWAAAMLYQKDMSFRIVAASIEAEDEEEAIRELTVVGLGKLPGWQLQDVMVVAAWLP